jgi:hypothetical protein
MLKGIPSVYKETQQTFMRQASVSILKACTYNFLLPIKLKESYHISMDGFAARKNFFVWWPIFIHSFINGSTALCWALVSSSVS